MAKAQTIICPQCGNTADYEILRVEGTKEYRRCLACGSEILIEEEKAPVIIKHSTHYYHVENMHLNDFFRKETVNVKGVQKVRIVKYLGGLGHCVDMTKMPDSVFSIGKDAFADCFTILDSVEICLPDGVEIIDEHAFGGAPFEEIDLPESLIEIGNRAFSGCINLKKIIIPKNVRRIGKEAFGFCTMLEEIVILGDTVIEEQTFSHCPTLKRVRIEGNPRIEKNAFPWTSLSGDNSSFEVVFQSKTGDLCVSGFDGSLVSSVTLSESVTAIGEGAFVGCHNLRQVDFSRAKRLKEIRAEAFQFCDVLESVELPPSVKIISDRSFSKCVMLKRIVIPEGLKTIGESAFNGCTGLKNVTLPKSLKVIGNRAFASCEFDSFEMLSAPAVKYTNSMKPASEFSKLLAEFNDVFWKTSIPDYKKQRRRYILRRIGKRIGSFFRSFISRV